MDIELLLIFLFSAALFFVALKYGIVGGGGGVTERRERPIAYWIGVAVTGLITIGALIALASSTLR